MGWLSSKGKLEIDYEADDTWVESYGSNKRKKLSYDVDYPVDYYTENDHLPPSFPPEWITEDMYKPRILKLKQKDGSHVDKRGQSAYARKFEYDPNVIRWNSKAKVLTWNNVKVSIIATDNEGRQIISVRKGAGEPIWLRFSQTQTEVRRAGKKATWS